MDILKEIVKNINFMEQIKAYIKLKDDAQSLKTKLQGLHIQKGDVELKVKNAERSGTKKRTGEVEHWLKTVEEIDKEFKALDDRIQEGGLCWLFRNICSPGDVAKMDARVKELIEQYQHFGEPWLDVFENKGEPRVTTELIGQRFLEGLESIKKWLETGTVSNIGIYGMGGVGKTTLAKHIHNYFLKKNEFEVYWITVSQEFSLKKLQDNIAKHVNLQLSHIVDEDTIAAKLSRALKQRQRSVLIILDDVWEGISLESIGNPLASGKCKLILTTRSLEVCRKMGCQKEFDVKTLDTNESWELFKYKFGLDRYRILPTDIKEIAKSVAKECDGLPLGIVTVAGSMRVIDIEDIHEWRNALEQLKDCSIGHEEMEEKVFPILEWSFNRLNECQKHCFLYCSLYPEDLEIEREELVNLFIGAELMDRRDTRQSEFDQGHTILNKLVRDGLLEKTSGWKDREFVKMHDLIRDMAIRITSGKSITENVPRFLVKSKGVKQKEWTEDLDAVSIWYVEEEIPSDMSPKCPKLSTLLFHGGNIKTIPDSFFRHMGGLKVLSLENCTNLTELPNCVSEMVNLTTLILQGCEKLEHVPPLGKLRQLRELNLSDSGIEHIPEGLKELINLESLEMVRTIWEGIIPKGTLSELHRLKQLKLPLGVQVCDPEVLNQLDVFHGLLSFNDICEPFKISRWPKHYALALLVEECCSLYLDWVEFFLDVDAKDKKLVFNGCNFGKGLDAASLPKDIQYLEFNVCVVEQSDVFQILNSSNDLHHLTINSLEGVEFLLKASSPPPLDSELIAIPYAPLPNLKTLHLEELPDLVGFFDYKLPLPPGTFSSLGIISISRCDKMRKLFTVQLLQSLKNLYCLRVSNCKGVEEIIGADEEEAKGSPSTSSGPTNSTLTLPQLSELNLSRLPRLKNICKTTIICNSICEIWVSDCPNVRRLPLFLPINGGQPSPLITLYLKDLPDFLGFFDNQLLLPPGTFSSLYFVWISGCHKMRKVFTVQLLQSLKNLKKLDVVYCKEVEEIIGANEEEARGSPSTSTGPTNTLRKLPLPPGTFSSLEFISISACDKMTKLFTVQLLQNLKNLKKLDVRYCKGVEEITADEEEARGSGPTNTLTLPPISELYLSGLPRLKNICKATIIRNSIKKMTVTKCPNVKRLPFVLPINDGQPSPGTFLTLYLEDLPDFLGFLDNQLLLPPGTFSSLEFVTILRCHKMRKLFTVQLLKSLKNLKKLHVINCKEVEEIIGADEEDARGSPSTSSGPTNTLTLPQLSKLYLYNLPRLKNICKATIICNSIQVITVSACPNVKRLPLFLPNNDGQSPPNTLRSIWGQKEWWESLEWDDPNDKITLDPSFIDLG